MNPSARSRLDRARSSTPAISFSAAAGLCNAAPPGPQSAKQALRALRPGGVALHLHLRSTARKLAEYCLAVAVLKSLEYTPLPIANALARFYATLLDRAIPRLRRVARRNLAMAMPDAAQERIIDGVFRSIARL